MTSFTPRRAGRHGVEYRAASPRPGATANDAASASVEEIAAEARARGLRRIFVLAWRDLEDAEAGGSELHAHRLAAAWAAAGLEVTMRTSVAEGRPGVAWRDGYRVVRQSGRYAVFAHSALTGLVGGGEPHDGMVEIWNGMPFFSPVWGRGPRIVFLHHVHAEMWGMVLPPNLARLGRFVERRLAPPLYRRSRIVTLSSSSRREIVDMLGIPAERVSVAPPGVDPTFSPGGERSPTPLVVAVGRLVRVKRFDALIDALAKARAERPDLQAVIVGEGSERPSLEARRRELGAEDWLALPGRLSDAELVDLYRRAWALASASQREGWGMTITEAGACGTPAVATRIAGHVDAVVHGRSGLLVDHPEELAGALGAVLDDDVLRRRLGDGARRHAARLTWEATAAATLHALVGEARPR